MWHIKRQEGESRALLRQIYFLLIGFVLVFFIGVLGIRHFENISFWDSVYFISITMATVGYGDIVPHTLEGKIFTVGYIVLSILTMYYITTLVFSLLVAGTLFKLLGRKKMDDKIKKMKNHYIVCGYGNTGEFIISGLLAAEKKFVVIESEKNICDELFERKIPVILGDATQNEVLEKAQIEHAEGLFASLNSDALNVYATMTAKSINEKVRIVAKAEKINAQAKLKMAGAERVILPNNAGAQSMLASMIQPNVFDFIGSVFDFSDLSLNVIQIKIKEKSFLKGKTIAEANLKKAYGLMVIAIKRQDERISVPHGSEKINAGDVIILMGSYEGLQKLKADAFS